MFRWRWCSAKLTHCLRTIVLLKRSPFPAVCKWYSVAVIWLVPKKMNSVPEIPLTNCTNLSLNTPEYEFRTILFIHLWKRKQKATQQKYTPLKLSFTWSINLSLPLQTSQRSWSSGAVPECRWRQIRLVHSQEITVAGLTIYRLSARSYSPRLHQSLTLVKTLFLIRGQ